MTRTVQQDRIRDGAVITFLAAVLIAVIAFQICLNTEPGQFLPKQLTLREDVTNVNIVRGIENTAQQAVSIRDALSGHGTMTAGECWSAFANDNFDPFFIFAVIFPGAARFILEVGFFLKFGLAAAFMYYLCCRNVGPGRKMSVILGLIYAFSSQVVFLAQFSAAMNMTVLFPLVLSSYDSFLRKRTGKNFAFAAVVSALFAASGTCADIVGLPFLALAALVICIALYDGAGTILSSWVRLLVVELFGFLMAGFVVFPRFASLEPSFDIESAFEKAAVNYTFFDILNRTKLLQSGGLAEDGGPVWYIGILTVTALVLFAANRKIPFKLKVCVLAITAVTFITSTSSFVRQMLTLVEVTPVITGCRFICLTAVLIFVAALSLKNVSDLPAGVYYAACVIPCAFTVLSNIREADSRNSSISLIATVAAYVICACAVKYVADGGTGKRMTVFTVAAAFVILGNTSFLIANNSVKPNAVNDPYGSRTAAEKSGLSVDEGFELSVFTGSDSIRYLLTSTDLSEAGDDIEYIQAVNLASGSAMIGDVFVRENSDSANLKNMTANGMNRYTISAGYNEISFTLGSSAGGRCFVYCGFSCPMTVRYRPSGMEIVSEYDGACLCEIGEGDILGNVFISFSPNDAETGEITFQRLIQENLDALNNATKEAEGLRFSFGYDDIPGSQGGIKTVVFSIPYSDEYTVSFNGNNAETFDYDGRLAAVFSCSENVPQYDVVIGRKVPGLGGGITVTVVMAAFLVAMTVRGGYNKKASSDDGKAGTDAQQEDN